MPIFDELKKAAADADVPQPTTTGPQTRKAAQKMKKREMRKALAVLGIDEGKPTAKAPPVPSITTALSVLKNTADVAEAQGDSERAASIRREALEIKLGMQDRARRSGGGVAMSRLGPNSAELFKSGLNTLPDDRSMGYL